MFSLAEVEHFTEKAKSAMATIDDATKQIQEAQVVLRDFVINKNFSLKFRYRIWEKYCEKVHFEQIPENPVLKKIIENGQISGLFSKGESLDWEDLMIEAVDILEYESDEVLREFLEAREVATVDDFRELLIAENFGDCIV